MGLNFGAKRKINNRRRIFLAARFFDGAYMNKPDQVEYEEDVRYNSVNGYLTELTFYKQDFYRTRYVFGFGRTEDIPYGYSLSFSSGYITQLGVERPYSAIKFAYSVANRKGNFFIFNAEAGSYVRSGDPKDGIFTTSVSYFTRALNLGNYKLRGMAIGGFSTLVNQDILPSLKISRSELISFSADSVWGNNKAFIRIEPTLYTPWELLGFRFATFLGGAAAWLDCMTCPKRNELFYQITGGLRTRNENLIFGTMEVRFTYLPGTDVTSSKFAFGFKQRLRVKNSADFVRAPSLVKY